MNTTHNVNVWDFFLFFFAAATGYFDAIYSFNFPCKRKFHYVASFGVDLNNFAESWIFFCSNDDL